MTPRWQVLVVELKEPGADAIRRLKSAWIDREKNLRSAVRKVSEFSTRYEASVSTLADILETQAALVFVHQALDELPDEVIDEVCRCNVPPSTWLLIRKLPDDAISDAIARLDRLAPGDRPITVVKEMVESNAAKRNDAVLSLPVSAFKHLSSKAKQYGLLRPKDRRALVEIPEKFQLNSKITNRQLGYLNGMLRQLNDEGILSKSCEDGRQCKHCARIEEILNGMKSG